MWQIRTGRCFCWAEIRKALIRLAFRVKNSGR